MTCGLVAARLPGSDSGHDILNSLGAPAGVLELLRDHPDLDEDEHHLIELAIAQLATLEAKIGALQAQVLRLDPAREPPRGPDHPGSAG